MSQARSVIDVILGEAGGKTRQQRYQDMLHIASVIANRAKATAQSVESVISAPRQFDAFNKSLPKGVNKFRSLAEQAWAEVQQNGPVTDATYYATPSAVGNLPSNLSRVSSTKRGHVYFSDPLNRPIATLAGYVEPSTTAAATAQPAADMFAPSLAPTANAGPAGRAYADLVRPSFVSTTSVPAKPAGLGLEALAPHGLLGDKTLATYDRSALDPTMASVMDTLAADPRFADVGVVSGYRDPTHNREVGGAKFSQHILGKAADVNIRDRTDEEKARFLDKALTAGVKGVGLYPSGAVHIDTRPNATFWGPQGYGYSSAPVSAAPSWAQPALGDLMANNAYTPRYDVPTPTARPSPNETVDVASQGGFAPGLTPASFDQPTSKQEQMVGPMALAAPSVLGGARGAALGALSSAAPQNAASALAPEQQDRVSPIAAGRLSPVASLDTQEATQPASSASAASNVARIAANVARQATQPQVSDAAPQSSLVSPSMLGAPATMAQQQTALAAQQQPSLSYAPAPVTPAPALQPDFPPAPNIEQSFPAAPKAQTRTERVKAQIEPALTRAALGMAIGGLPGAALGLASSFAPSLGELGIGPLGHDPFSGMSPYSVGSGANAIQSTFGAPRGATAYSRSRPGYSTVSFGPGLGGARVGPFGWQAIDASGETRGGLHNGTGITGFLDSIFGGGGSDGRRGGFSQSERDTWSGRTGLF